jgi:hypothetical protein
MLWVNPATKTVVVCFGSVTHPLGQDSWTCRLQLYMAEAIDRYLVEHEVAESTP